jgi:hypothetical protein
MKGKRIKRNQVPANKQPTQMTPPKRKRKMSRRTNQKETAACQTAAQRRREKLTAKSVPKVKSKWSGTPQGSSWERDSKPQ